MAEKIIAKNTGLRLLLVVTLFVTFAGWCDAQQPPSGSQAAQQTWKLKHISAENAKRTLTQTLAMEVVVQVNPETNEVNLIGPAATVLSAIQALQEIDRPSAPPQHLNPANPPNTLRSNAPQPLGRDDFSSSQPYEVIGGNNWNAVQNPPNMPSGTNLSFRDPTRNPNDNPPFSTSFHAPGNPTVEGYEPGTYFCKPSHLARMSNELQSRYGHDRNIAIETLPERGKILVWAPQRVQQEITAMMTQAGAWAEVPAGRDPREFEGTLLRFAPESRPPETVRQPVMERTHSPNYTTLEQIEAKLQGLFGNRMTAISAPNEMPKKYRVAIPQRPQGMIVCELTLDYPGYQIHIRAPQNIAVEMSRLLQAIDRESPGEGRERRFISIQNADVDQIRKLLNIYNSRPVPDSSRRLRNNPNMLAYQRNGNTSRPPIRQINYQDEGGLGGLGGGYDFGQTQGAEDIPGRIDNPTQMSIQVIPNLDIVVIDAPMEEVNRIMDMIEKIEELSKLAESKIEIMPLKHVHCEALDSLLRTELRTVYSEELRQMNTIYLYMEMFATKQGRVWVLPLHNPNAMLIVGWGQALEAMKALIEHLDKPVDAEFSLLRVIKLEHAPAEQVATVLTDFFNPPALPPSLQGMANTGFSPRIRALHDPRTNTLIVQAAPNDYRDIERIVAELDVDESGLKLQVKTFKMKNLLAADMKTALDSALEMAMNGTVDQRFPTIEIVVGSEQNRRIIQSGFLTEVSISAVTENNLVVVTAPGNCMPLMEELINMLDQSQGEAMVKVIRINHSDAQTIQRTLRDVFPTQLEGMGGVPLPGSDGGETFIPMNFAIDTRSNSIIVAGAANDIFFVESLIQKLDQKDALQRETKTYQLRNSSATDVSAAIMLYLDERRRLQEMDVVSDYQKLQDSVIVVPESITNTLIISASDQYMAEIENMVKTLDQEPPQVMIQVLIAEVTLGKTDEFGIELGIQDPLLFNRSSVATGELIPGYNFNNPAGGLGNSNSAESLANAGTVATQMLSNFATGRVNNDTGFGGLIFSASSDAVSVLIRAMQECNRVEVLSRPQISAQDNQLAVIFVGQKVTLPGPAIVTQGISQPQTTSESVGLFVGVVPRISRGATLEEPDKPDKIDMLISASNSTIGGDGITIPSGSGSVRIP
ncbi:MAG: hypothetical protein FWH27_17290, partial [Planctomycetaceae bacterium]|nr:hypothetical protein [Planctomycetaceae bacterium]